MTALEVAREHYRDRQRLVRATATAGVALWREVDSDDLSASWLARLHRLITIVTGAQVAAAREADHYTDAVLGEQGIDATPMGRLRAESLAGVASDGRPLESLLQWPVITTKAQIARGATIRRAKATGQAHLDMILRTQVADAGRVADGVAVAARPRVGYVRMLVGDSCPQCAILAGRFYRYSDGFERHPDCNCIHIPSQEDTAGDFRTDPQAAFREGRIKGLSKADRQAVEDGADLNQVVNARRGMSTAGRRKVTREGTARRGIAGSRLRGDPRLMPEQIYRESSSREDAARLLRQHGYII